MFIQMCLYFETALVKKTMESLQHISCLGVSLTVSTKIVNHLYNHKIRKITFAYFEKSF